MNKSSDQSFQERQDNEFLSIAAIFPNEVKDLRKTKPLKWFPLEMEITIFPEESMTADKECNIHADLYIRCSKNYPDSTPFIDFRNAKGISHQELNELKSELIRKAEELAGNESILELVNHSRAFLYSHKRPQYDSFFDEMVWNKSKKLQEEAERKERESELLKLQECQTLLAIEQERMRKIEALKDANRKTRFADDSCLSPINNVDTRSRKASMSHRRSRSTSNGHEVCSSENNLQSECKDMLNTRLKFVGKKEFTVVCGRCLGHSERGCITYSGFDSATGTLVIVIKWTLLFNVNHKLKGEEWEALQKEQSFYLKQLASIEQEFKAVRQVDCKHLVHYLGMYYTTKKDRIGIYVLQEFVHGCAISSISKDPHLTTQQLQHYTREILDALKHLHDSSVVHKNLRLSSLFLDKSGSIRMADFSLDKRLYDLSRMLTKEDEIDPYPLTIGKGGKKGDIYRFGILLLTLVTNECQKNAPVIVPDYLNPTFKDFLNKCLLHDEQERWSADQLLSHPFVAYASLTGLLPKEDLLKDDEDMEENSLTAFMSNEALQGSRLHHEFDILKVLGKGGFGHVWKVKNKLDSRVYALKRIPLNPSNKQLNRKIKREVKLLSRLNHENIVRYYNSWIEAASETNQLSQNGEFSESELSGIEKTKSSVRWNVHGKDFSSSEEDEDDDFIVFLSGEKESDSSDKKKNLPLASKVKVMDSIDSTSPEADQLTVGLSEKSQSTIKQFMFIQMQFCEKSTLRTAIDNGLHQDISLVWRLFREIVEGLHYIHQQGVIHRDLKPVNIFLDSNDHVKIGDFGLATDVISKPGPGEFFGSEQDPQSHSEVDDGTQTGRVGTAFYVAPELASSGKVSYSQKVDIYSLGIIFFEMCYPPPVTLMERNIILSKLRQYDIVLPENSPELLTEEMLQIIKWLLQHDVTKRPSSNELITSKYIPPLLMEETELNNLLHNTISNPQSRMYKHMISALFDQKVSTEFDFTYDIDVFRSQSYKNKPSQIFSNVVDVLNKIMCLHAAVFLSVPTLMPKSSVIDNEYCVQIMEHGGGIVVLPHNLRVPFARYLARREIDHMKRYSLEKVFRQQKIYGCHPREQYEFVYDIVTPTPNSYLPDAEVISTISEIISEFSSLENRNYYFRLNHPSLLKAILLYSEVDENIENELYDIAGDQRDKSLSKAVLLDEHNNLNLSQRSISRLCQFIEIEETIERMSQFLYPVLQKKGKVCTLAKNSLKELENIVSLTQALGVKLPILICPGLVHNITLFSGMFFQCICKLKTLKKKQLYDILSAGGRYDKLIQSFKLKALVDCGKTISQSAVGASVAIESIVAAESESSENQETGIADFLIYSEGTGMAMEKAALMKELQDMGLRATVLYDKNMTFVDAAVFCSNQGISHILVLQKEEKGLVKVCTMEKDRVSEKRMIRSEIKDVLPKLFSKTASDVKSDYVRSSSVSNSSLMINVRFLGPDKTHNNKKREQNIRTHVISTFKTTSRVWELITVDLKMGVIGTIISYCDISASVDALQRSFDGIIDEFGKHKKYLSQLCDEICDIRTKNPDSSIILYSLPDSNFRVLL